MANKIEKYILFMIFHKRPSALPFYLIKLKILTGKPTYMTI